MADQFLRRARLAGAASYVVLLALSYQAVANEDTLDQKQLTGVSDITTASFGTPFASIYAPLTRGIEVDHNF